MAEKIAVVNLDDRVGAGGCLSAAEMNEIRDELTHYQYNQAACIEALKIVQRHRGWVSSESLKSIASFLKLSADEVEGVATFYNLIYRQKVGKHVIRVCDSVTCWMLGFDKIRAALNSDLGVDLGGTTQDAKFTLLPGPCLGACDHAPVLMVNDDYHYDVNANAVSAILRKYS